MKVKKGEKGAFEGQKVTYNTLNEGNKDSKKFAPIFEEVPQAYENLLIRA